MKISIISVFPELHKTFTSYSLIAKAIERGLLSFNLIKLSSLCPTKVRIDEPTCGPGVGMIIKPELIEKAINTCEKQWGPGIKIFFSPQGKKINQNIIKKFMQEIHEPTSSSHDKESSKTSPHLIFICSRYEGTDVRVEQEYADYIFSIGDYVLMGGDLPAQVLLEALLRLLPGIVGKLKSVEQDSFTTPFLDYPQYGLPVEWKNKKVPAILLSGNHKAIEQWRNNQACKKTIYNHFDWFRKNMPSPQEIKLSKKHIPNHYVALMHSQVLIKGKEAAGHTSIASLDIHDVARSSKTYGISKFFIISALKDQQYILKEFLNFWHSQQGKQYNKSRYDAVALVKPLFELQQALAYIRQKEKNNPIIIATSAKQHNNTEIIDYHSQGKIWKQNRPILFLFGTGQGLADEILDKCNYLLTPLQGLSDYNHLSVRAAVAIILDRWLGLHPEFTITNKKDVINIANN